jgi:hypothetical protein
LLLQRFGFADYQVNDIGRVVAFGSAIKKRPPHGSDLSISLLRSGKPRVSVSSYRVGIVAIDCELKKQVLAPQSVSEKAMRDFPMLTRKDPSKHDHDEVALLMS